MGKDKVMTVDDAEKIIHGLIEHCHRRSSVDGNMGFDYRQLYEALSVLKTPATTNEDNLVSLCGEKTKKKGAK